MVRPGGPGPGPANDPHTEPLLAQGPLGAPHTHTGAPRSHTHTQGPLGATHTHTGAPRGLTGARSISGR